MTKVRLTIAWVFLLGGIAGFTLSATRVIAKEEPLLVLLLSWAALIYEGFNAVVLNGAERKQQQFEETVCRQLDEISRQLQRAA